MQRYAIMLQDGNGQQHEIEATGNTFRAALYVASLSADQHWPGPHALIAYRFLE